MTTTTMTTTATRRPVDRPRGAVRLTPLAPLAVLGLWVWYVLAYNPIDRVPDPTGPCLWHRLFGIDGPTCGITRMTWYLLHGDLVHAAQMHLLALAGLPAFGYGYAWWIAAFWLGRRLPLPTARNQKWLAIGYAAAFLIYAVVLRNLPWPPFAWFGVPDLTP